MNKEQLIEKLDKMTEEEILEFYETDIDKETAEITAKYLFEKYQGMVRPKFLEKDLNINPEVDI